MSKQERAEAVGAEAARKPVCFVVSPIGEANSEERKRSDQVLKHLVKNALEPEYTVIRADNIDRPGIITVQIVQQVFDAQLVVADLTNRNPNVYYELAIRHAARKPAIHIISRGQDIPFDVQDMRVVPYDLADPDSLEEAQKKLREYTKAIEQGEPVITPVQFAQILRSFEAGETRDAQLLGLLQSLNIGISNLQEGIAEVVQDVRQRKSREIWANLSSPVTPLSSLAMMANPPASGFSFRSNIIPDFTEQISPQQKAEAIRKIEGAAEKE